MTSTTTGSCLCGNLSISYEGEPQLKALCHCNDCRKICGSTYSTNLVVPGDGFKSNGQSKTFTKQADNGNPITSHFCPECGSTLWRDGPSFGENKVVKSGVLDSKDIQESAKPTVELYAPRRLGWVAKQSGASDAAGMS